MGGSGSRGFTKLLQEAGNIVVPTSNSPLDWLIGNIFNYAKEIADTVHSTCYNENSFVKKNEKRLYTQSIYNVFFRQLLPIPSLISHFIHSNVNNNKNPVDIAIKHGPFLFALPLFVKAIGRNRIKFVHYVRDGRDMAFSDNHYQLQYFGQGLQVTSSKYSLQQQMALLWSKLNLEFVKCSKEYLDKDEYILVKFEDFVTSNHTKRIEHIKTFFNKLNIQPLTSWDFLAKTFDKAVGVNLEFNAKAHERKWENRKDKDDVLNLPELKIALKEFGYV